MIVMQSCEEREADALWCGRGSYLAYRDHYMPPRCAREDDDGEGNLEV
jgi:hypothetical protein